MRTHVVDGRRQEMPAADRLALEELEAVRPIAMTRVTMSDFVAGALTAAEIGRVLRAAVAGDDAAAQFYAVLTAHGHVTLGDDLTDPERRKTEAMLDQAVAAGWLVPTRKAEILAWRPAP